MINNYGQPADLGLSDPPAPAGESVGLRPWCAEDLGVVGEASLDPCISLVSSVPDE
jgi:hypothetical protein